MAQIATTLVLSTDALCYWLLAESGKASFSSTGELLDAGNDLEAGGLSELRTSPAVVFLRCEHGVVGVALIWR